MLLYDSNGERNAILPLAIGLMDIASLIMTTEQTGRKERKRFITSCILYSKSQDNSFHSGLIK